MEILSALLEKDFHLKMDFLDNFNDEFINSYVFPITYKNNINFMKNFYKNERSELKFKLRDILNKFNKEIQYMIYEFENQNIKDVPEENWSSIFLYDLLALEDPYSNKIIEEVKKFYIKYFDRQILVSNNNLSHILDTIIDINESITLKNDFHQVFTQYFAELNEDIGQNIIRKFNLSLQNNNYKITSKSYDFLRKKLHIFFKVVGKDFIRLIEEPIKKNDGFNLLYAKVNKDFFRICRMELSDLNNDRYTTLLKDEEMILLLFIFCVDCDVYQNSSLTKVISEKFKENEATYIRRSIEIHNNFNF